MLLKAGVDTGNAVYKRFAERSSFGVPATRVGISAHIGGMIVGCITGIVFLRDVRIHSLHISKLLCCSLIATLSLATHTP